MAFIRMRLSQDCKSKTARLEPFSSTSLAAFGLLVSVLMVFVCPPVSARDDARIAGQLPFRAGTYWIFAGPVEADIGHGKTIKEVVNWKMEVTSVLKNGRFTVAVIAGHPNDLWWYEPGRKRGDYLLVKRADNYYLVTDENARRAVKEFKQRQPLDKYIRKDNLVLAFPLKVGKLFGKSGGDPSSPMFCWSVEKNESYDLAGVEGVKPPLKRTAYELVYRANTDQTIVDFVPGIGFVHQTSAHHGTVSKFDVRLTEFRY